MSEKQSVAEAVEEYCTQLRRRQITGSLPCARRTAEIMRVLVTMQRHADAAALIDDVRSVGYKIQAAKPVELAIGNIVRRVLHLIREEVAAETEAARAEAEKEAGAAAEKAGKQQPPQAGGPGLLAQALKLPGGTSLPRPLTLRAVSLSNLLDVGMTGLDQLISQPSIDPSQAQGGLPHAQSAAPALDHGRQQQQQQQHADYEVDSQVSTARPGQAAKAPKRAPANWKNKHVIIDAINDLIDELENITTSITVQGVEHIHANEVILTMGMSDTTYAFLREAAKKREFQVVVAEGAPRYDGHVMARKLADAGIQTTAIADSMVFAMMARANKVLVGAHAVLANGGIIAPCGIHMVALAARKHSIPFVVLVGLHKLSPLFPHDPDLAYNDFKSPAELVDMDVLAEAFQQSEGAAAAKADGASEEGAPERDPLTGTVHIPNPAFDYIPPHLISLFITDSGGYTPSYVYRLLTDTYSREDYLLSKELHFGR